MLFTYKFATNSVTVDLDEEWVTVLEELDRQEENNDLKERHRHYHFDT